MCTKVAALEKQVRELKDEIAFRDKMSSAIDESKKEDGEATAPPPVTGVNRPIRGRRPRPATMRYVIKLGVFDAKDALLTRTESDRCRYQQTQERLRVAVAQPQDVEVWRIVWRPSTSSHCCACVSTSRA